MQLMDFALLGLAVAAPVAQQAAEISQATTCPDLDGAQVVSDGQQAYKLDCSKYVEAGADQIIEIVTTQTGYKGCLDACDKQGICAISQYVATDDAQTQGSCTLWKGDVTVKDGSKDAPWTLATKIPSDPAPIVPIVDGDAFRLNAIHSGNRDIHLVGLKAVNGSLFVGGRSMQGASCDKPDQYATFYIRDGGLFLYNEGIELQQFYVDASGMGQGVTPYTTGLEPIPRYAQRETFAIDEENHLMFNGVGALACPPTENNPDAGYTIWFTNLEKPAGLEGCVGAVLRASKVEDPASCIYTQRKA